MNRRKFLTLSALSIPAATLAEEERGGAPLKALNLQDPDQWWSTASERMEYTAKSDDGVLVLAVKLIEPEDGEISEASGSKGEFSHYTYKGVKLEEGFWPGRSLLVDFSFKWAGEAIPVAERFWKYLPGFRILVSDLDAAKVGDKLAGKLEEFKEGLGCPRVIPSGDGGTALIEWERGEECDGRSTIRWIISRSGVVMRHRHTPPHEC